MASNTTALVLGGIPRVNLLPQAESERRERRQLSRRWATAAVAAVIVAILVIGAAFALRWIAERNLALQQQQTAELITELASLSEISGTITESAELEAFRTDAMVRDFAWTPLFDEVAQRLPEGVTVVQVSLAPRADPAITAGAPPETVGASGTVTFTAAETGAQAATVAALGDLPGLISVDAGSLFAAGESGVEFSIALVYDTSIYSGAYAVEGGED